LKQEKIIGVPAEKSNLEEIGAILDFFDERAGGGRGKGSAWVDLAPKLMTGLENISGNVARMFSARGGPVVVSPPVNANAANAGPAGSTSAPAVAPPSPTAPPIDPDAIIGQFLKLRFVELYLEKDEKGEPLNDAENVGNWLGMTAPKMAVMLKLATIEEAVEFFKKDPVIGQICADAKGQKFLEEVIKAVKKE